METGRRSILCTLEFYKLHWNDGWKACTAEMSILFKIVLI